MAVKLLAKSIRNGREISLESHLRDTAKAASYIFSSERRVGRNFQKAFKVSAQSDKFMLNLLVACLFHDIGKANEGFVKALGGKRNSQVIRHEHLSALILQLPAVKSWLASNPLIDHEVVTAAVLGHHLKAALNDFPSVPNGAQSPVCDLYLHSLDVQNILSEVSRLASLAPPPLLDGGDLAIYSPTLEAWSGSISDIQELEGYLSISFSNCGVADADRRQMLAAVRLAVIIADSVASATVRENVDVFSWLDDNLHLPRLRGEELREKIIERKISAISQSVGKPFEESAFQRGMRQLGRRALLVAGCGQGKTLAAYLWAESKLVESDFGRVVFLYPTRGTATQGFFDYTGLAPEEDALLMHSSAKYVLDSIASNPDDSASRDSKFDEAKERMFSLSNYRRRFYSATIDQFLSFVEYDYPSILMSLVLSDSLVILDEVHSYDSRIFSKVCDFLRYTEIPTLCMTATIPSGKATRLEELNIQRYPSSSALEEKLELDRAESKPRYSVSQLASVEECFDICRNAINSGAKVLWVANTVAKCQEIFLKLVETHRDSLLCYHSRFRLLDRENRHASCVKSFQPCSESKAGVAAITTQVCEMSLDLDADVLITEIAPIASLIQRMGRANRHPDKRTPGFVSEIYCYPFEDKPLPYEISEVEEARCFLSSLVSLGGPVSQRTLAEYLENSSQKSCESSFPRKSRLFEPSLFVDGQGSLREEADRTVQAILTGDVKEAESDWKIKKYIDRFLLPVPLRCRLTDDRPSWLPPYVYLASTEKYREDIGFVAD